VGADGFQALASRALTLAKSESPRLSAVRVSIDGQLRKIMVVIKMRGGNHAKDIREYEITSKGVVILGKRLTNFQGLISGVPVHSNRSDLKEEPAQEPEIGSKG